MKIIGSLLLIALTTCAFKVHGQVKDETAGERQYYDSAHYSIILGNFVTGERFLRCYSDNQTGLSDWTTYYKNGQTKVHGQMTTGNHIYVGRWSYYQETGELVSIVDFDKKFPVSYFDAIDFAASQNFPTDDVSETYYEDEAYWQFIRWQEEDEEHLRTGVPLLVSKRTGESFIPDNVIITISH